MLSQALNSLSAAPVAQCSLHPRNFRKTWRGIPQQPETCPKAAISNQIPLDLSFDFRWEKTPLLQEFPSFELVELLFQKNLKFLGLREQRSVSRGLFAECRYREVAVSVLVLDV